MGKHQLNPEQQYRKQQKKKVNYAFCFITVKAYDNKERDKKKKRDEKRGIFETV